MNIIKRARPLVKSERHPAYQLWATTRNEKLAPKEQLKIAALISVEWLRGKFSENDMPDELRLPTYDRHAEVSFDDLRSLHIDAGYVVDIVSLPEQGIWTLRLIEPDMSRRFDTDGKPGENIAVPGRLYETDFAFRTMQNTLEVAVRVVISSPQEPTESEPMRAFRPVIVQALTECELLGLRCGRYPIDASSCIALSKDEQLKQLRDQLTGGNLPAVVLCDYEKQAPTLPQVSVLMTNEKRMELEFLTAQELMTARRQSAQPVCPLPEKDIPNLLLHRMGYAVFFTLERKRFDRFKRIVGTEPENGDVLVLEPAAFGGGVIRLPHKDGAEANLHKLRELLLRYPYDKPFRYGNAVFPEEARRMQREETAKSRSRVSDVLDEMEQITESYRRQLGEQKADGERTLELFNSKIRSKDEEIQRQKELAAEAKREGENAVQKARKEMEQLRRRIAYLESLEERPKDARQVAEWAGNRFGERIVFTEQAEKRLLNTPAETYDMKLLCDAIEYLSTEYYDGMLGTITKDEAAVAGSKKYGRAFRIVKESEDSAAVKRYPSDYTVWYKEKKYVLSEHLRVGGDTENLVRIYYFYDKDIKKFVIGSLPGHLRTTV